MDSFNVNFDMNFGANESFMKPVEGETPGFFFGDEGIDTTAFDFNNSNTQSTMANGMGSFDQDLFAFPQENAGFGLQQNLNMDDTMQMGDAWNSQLSTTGMSFASINPASDNTFSSPSKRPLELDTALDFPTAKRQEMFSPFPTSTSLTGSSAWEQQTPATSVNEIGLSDEAADVCLTWFSKYNVLPSDRHIESLSHLTGESANAIRTWFGQMLKQGLAGHDSAYKSLTSPEMTRGECSYTSLSQEDAASKATCNHDAKEQATTTSQLPRGGKKGCTPTSNPDLLSRDPNKIYQCTRKCGKRYGRKCDWKRNEEEGYPSKSWMCSLCISQGVERVKPCFRKYHFSQHFRNIHPGVDAKDYEAASVVQSDSGFPTRCGFCPHRFTSRQDRIDHIAEHFKKGKCMLDWNDDSDENSNDSDDADDDDNRPDSDGSDGNSPSRFQADKDNYGFGPGRNGSGSGGSSGSDASGGRGSMGGFTQCQFSQMNGGAYADLVDSNGQHINECQPSQSKLHDRTQSDIQGDCFDQVDDRDVSRDCSIRHRTPDQGACSSRQDIELGTVAPNRHVPRVPQDPRNDAATRDDATAVARDALSQPLTESSEAGQSALMKEAGRLTLKARANATKQAWTGDLHRVRDEIIAQKSPILDKSTLGTSDDSCSSRNQSDAHSTSGGLVQLATPSYHGLRLLNQPKFSGLKLDMTGFLSLLANGSLLGNTEKPETSKWWCLPLSQALIHTTSNPKSESPVPPLPAPVPDGNVASVPAALHGLLTVLATLVHVDGGHTFKDFAHLLVQRDEWRNLVNRISQTETSREDCSKSFEHIYDMFGLARTHLKQRKLPRTPLLESSASPHARKDPISEDMLPHVRPRDVSPEVTLHPSNEALGLIQTRSMLTASQTCVKTQLESDVPLSTNLKEAETAPSEPQDLKCDVQRHSPIAIVGMSGRFPRASPEELWALLGQGLDPHRKVGSERFDMHAFDHLFDQIATPEAGKKIHTPYERSIDEPGFFDSRFFNVSPAEAGQDPQRRLAIMTAYEALEAAGFVPSHNDRYLSESQRQTYDTAKSSSAYAIAAAIFALARKESGLVESLNAFGNVDTIVTKDLHGLPALPNVLDTTFATQSFLSVKLLGTGGFSTVDEVLHRETKLRIGRKTLKNRDPNVLEEIKKEVGVLQKLRHPHVIRYLGAYSKGDKVSILVSPVAECTLNIWLERSLIEKPADLPQTVVRMYGCLASSVRYLHEQRPVVRHLDIKPQNILVKQGSEGFPHVVLCDFGISSSDDHKEEHPQPLTRQYCAPEVPGAVARGPKADIWSLGCAYLEMAIVAFNLDNKLWHKFRQQFCGCDGKCYWQDVARLHNCVDAFITQAGTLLEKDVLTTVKSMLSEDPSERPDASTLTIIFTPAPCCLGWANDNLSFPGPHEELSNFELLIQKDSVDVKSKIQESITTTKKDSNGIEQAKSWLKACTYEHAGCHHHRAALKVLPTRLLEIQPAQTDGQISVRLINTSEMAVNDINYVALSHTWSRSNEITLTTDKEQSLQREIPLHAWSEPVYDAISVARDVGFKYVWLDSLCVVQDSEEDRQKECARMAAVYRNSALTIVVNNDNRHQSNAILSDKVDADALGIALDFSSPAFAWDTRAWSLQERLLSHRLLHLTGSQMYWECNALKASETFPQGLPSLLWEKVHSRSSVDMFASNDSHRHVSCKVATSDSVGLPFHGGKFEFEFDFEPIACKKHGFSSNPKRLSDAVQFASGYSEQLPSVKEEDVLMGLDLKMEDIVRADAADDADTVMVGMV